MSLAPSIMRLDRASFRARRDELVSVYARAYRGLERYAYRHRPEQVGYLEWLYRGDPEGFLVAEVDRRAVGFASCHGDWLGWPDRVVAELHEIVVEPEAQGQGVGRLLLQAVFDYARARGRDVLGLWVGEGNRRARHWYRRVGFEEEGKVGKWVRMTARVPATAPAGPGRPGRSRPPGRDATPG
ncbi:MAG TPA: GNAT family N-acetyltransferase [Actinomycetota bacterium]|nr:GNAT family N-acetyltransferase [Actinomycetota bacterium]